MASLLDEIAALPTSRRGPVCGIASASASLDESERVHLQTALTERKPDGTFRYAARQIKEALANRHIHLGRFTVDRHRRGDCRCAR